MLNFKTPNNNFCPYHRSSPSPSSHGGEHLVRKIVDFLAASVLPGDIHGLGGGMSGSLAQATAHHIESLLRVRKKVL